MQQLRSGKIAALEQLVHAEWEPLVRYAHDLLGSVDAAEDVAQEVFVELWHRRDQWEGILSLRAYLYRSVRNRAMNEQRRQRVREEWLRIQPPGGPGPSSPSREMETAALRRAIDAALAALSPRRREVFVLFRLHSLSYHEIAEVLGVSDQTVANTMSAALAELRRALAAYATHV